jgi:DNA (cytosine-5)-methyltransferase 1
MGRPAPVPARDNRLNPEFVEWMMGLPQGWVTGTGISHSAQLRVLGNGIVPQQAAAFIRSVL